MGRPQQNRTKKLEDFGCVIDIAWLRREGVRQPGQTGSIVWSENDVTKASVAYVLKAEGLNLAYEENGEARTELVPIVCTPAPLGGRRHWFSCPGCARRCRIVYYEKRFLCRLCLGAQYASKYSDATARISARRWRLRQRLEGSEGVFDLDDGLPPKPRQMRWRTYKKLEVADKLMEQRWNEWVHARLSRARPEQGWDDPALERLYLETAPPTQDDEATSEPWTGKNSLD